MTKIFGIRCAHIPDAFFTILAPKKVDTILLRLREHFRGRYTDDSYSTSREYDNVRRICTLPKFSVGKFGNPAFVSYSDQAIYSMFFFAFLPWLLMFYSTFIFIAPPFFSTLITPILRIFGKKVIIIVTDAWVELAMPYRPDEGVPPIKKAKLIIGRLLEIYAVKNSNEVFVVSKYLFDLYKCHNENIFWIPTGADVEKIHWLPKKRMFEEPTIVYLGGFERWRGIDMLIDAYRLIKHEINVKLMLIGDGPDFEQIKKYVADELGIKLTGGMPHDDAISYVKGSDIAVMPARDCLVARTISSIKCFEYMACGTPSVVTDSGEHAYWTKKYGTGVVVKDTVTGIANGVLNMLQSRKLYEKIKENCEKHRRDVDFRKTREVYIRSIICS